LSVCKKAANAIVGKGKMTKESLIFSSAFAGVCILFFVLLCFINRWLQSWLKKVPTIGISYDVMERSGKRIALRNPSKFGWLMGLTYVGIFYLSLPVLIWRYGNKQAFWLIIFPPGISIIISQLIAYIFASDAKNSRFFMSIIFRAVVGLYVMANDLEFRKNILIIRGWEIIGTCEATSSKNAIHFFFDSPKKSDAKNEEIRSRRTSIFTGLKARLPKFS
jgi:hypothetical protein